MTYTNYNYTKVRCKWGNRCRVYGNSLSYLLNFSINLKLVYKNKLISKTKHQRGGNEKAVYDEQIDKLSQIHFGSNCQFSLLSILTILLSRTSKHRPRS